MKTQRLYNQLYTNAQHKLVRIHLQCVTMENTSVGVADGNYMLTFLQLQKNAVLSYVLTSLVCIVGIAAVVANVLLFVTFARSKRLEQPFNYPLVSLAVADVIGAIFWVLPSVAPTIEWRWTLGYSVCQMQGVMATLCYALNAHTLTFVCVERFLAVWWPSKHREVFTHSATLWLLATVWVMDFVVALFPVMGWGKLVYVQSQLQCAFDHSKSVSQLSFTFAVVYAIPFVAVAILYGYSLAKVVQLRRRAGSDGVVILETSKDARKETYADKFHRQEKRLAAARTNAAKKNKMAAKNKMADMSSEDSSGESDNEAAVTSYVDWSMQQKARRRVKNGMYVLKRRDFRALVTMFVTWLIYVTLWLPYVIVNYLWTYQPGSVSAEMYAGATFISFVGTAYKPFVYVFNKHFRHDLKLALGQKGEG